MDLWKELKEFAEAGRPLLCYGMGDGADKLRAVCAERGLSIADTFASDGFVRGQTFHGKRVLSYSEAMKQYENPVILLAFGSSRPEVLETAERIAATHTLRIPELPVTVEPGERVQPFDEDFFAAHREEIEAAGRLFTEPRSRALYERMLAYSLGGRWEDLTADTATEEEQLALLDGSRYRSILDLGAYNGDSASFYARHCPELTVIYGAEPDPHSFRRLEKFALEEGNGIVKPIHAAAWDRRTTLTFSAKGNRNSSALGAGSGAAGVEIQALPPDEMTENSRVDFIKYDVEGAEARALRGSARLLAGCPDILLSLYHRREDTFALPLLLQELLGAQNAASYGFYLRRAAGFPAWDLRLLAKKIRP